MPNTHLLARIRREFQDHPGIAVTLPQAQMIWAVGHERCSEAFEALLSEGFLKRVDDIYMWGDAPAPRFRRQSPMRPSR